MQQGIVGVAGRDSEFGQGNLFASRRGYEGAVENASDTCLTAAANGVSALDVLINSVCAR